MTCIVYLQNNAWCPPVLIFKKFLKQIIVEERHDSHVPCLSDTTGTYDDMTGSGNAVDVRLRCRIHFFVPIECGNDAHFSMFSRIQRPIKRVGFVSHAQPLVRGTRPVHISSVMHKIPAVPLNIPACTLILACLRSSAYSHETCRKDQQTLSCYCCKLSAHM